MTSKASGRRTGQVVTTSPDASPETICARGDGHLALVIPLETRPPAAPAGFKYRCPKIDRFCHKP